MRLNFRWNVPSVFLLWLTLFTLAVNPRAGSADEAAQGLRIATFSTDITPHLGQPVGQGFIPALEPDEHPLLARGIIFKDSGLACVLSTLDLMEEHNET